MDAMMDREEATSGRRGWVLIEQENALYRGPSPGWPMEVWSPSQGWQPCGRAGELRPVEWGNVISEDDAYRLMVERGR